MVVSNIDLLFTPMLVFNTYLVLYKYKTPEYIGLFILTSIIFIIAWDNQEKYLWLLIFFIISITMTFMENLMIYINGSDAIEYKYKYYLNIPYWLPMVYWNIVFFTAFLFYKVKPYIC
jgi:hypothetical protein